MEERVAERFSNLRRNGKLSPQLEASERFVRKDVYRKTLGYLQSLHLTPQDLDKYFPNEHFHYEKGFVLKLPDNLAYISTESAEDIRILKNSREIEIGNEGWPTVEPNFIDIGCCLPLTSIPEINKFVVRVKSLYGEHKQQKSP